MSIGAVSGKNARFVEAGRRGALRRWGPPRIVRLDELTAEQARLVRALVDAARGNEKAAGGVETPAAELEGHAHDRPAA